MSYSITTYLYGKVPRSPPHNIQHVLLRNGPQPEWYCHLNVLAFNDIAA